jgi:hypothetical protein
LEFPECPRLTKKRQFGFRAKNPVASPGFVCSPAPSFVFIDILALFPVFSSY